MARTKRILYTEEFLDANQNSFGISAQHILRRQHSTKTMIHRLVKNEKFLHVLLYKPDSLSFFKHEVTIDAIIEKGKGKLIFGGIVLFNWDY